MNPWTQILSASDHTPFAQWCVYQVMPDDYGCGHPKDESNTLVYNGYARCKTCHQANSKRYYARAA
jgi:hypothetical protein